MPCTNSLCRLHLTFKPNTTTTLPLGLTLMPPPPPSASSPKSFFEVHEDSAAMPGALQKASEKERSKLNRLHFIQSASSIHATRHYGRWDLHNCITLTAHPANLIEQTRSQASSCSFGRNGSFSDPSGFSTVLKCQLSNLTITRTLEGCMLKPIHGPDQ